MKFIKKRFWFIFIIVLVVIQFKRIDKTNPSIDPSMDFMTIESPPDDIQNLITSACYDCHSHETVYPWYTNVAPLSWWIKGHIDHGRENLNFSRWGEMSEREKLHSLEECEDMIKKEWMPLGSYARMHSKAKLTDQDREEIMNWIQGKY